MEKIKMQPTRPEDALLTDAFADFLEKCRAKNLSEKTLNIYLETLKVRKPSPIKLLPFSLYISYFSCFASLAS